MVIGLVGVIGILIALPVQKRFRDVTERSQYNLLLRREYTLQRTMIVHGVTTHPDYRGGVDYYSIKPSPGAAGPEILERFRIEPGTVLTIANVLECSNCWFDDEVTLIVKIPGIRKFDGQTVRLEGVVRNDSENRLVLDPQYFIAAHAEP